MKKMVPHDLMRVQITKISVYFFFTRTDPTDSLVKSSLRVKPCRSHLESSVVIGTVRITRCSCIVPPVVGAVLMLAIYKQPPADSAEGWRETRVEPVTRGAARSRVIDADAGRA